MPVAFQKEKGVASDEGITTEILGSHAAVEEETERFFMEESGYLGGAQGRGDLFDKGMARHFSSPSLVSVWHWRQTPSWIASVHNTGRS